MIRYLNQKTSEKKNKKVKKFQVHMEKLQQEIEEIDFPYAEIIFPDRQDIKNFFVVLNVLEKNSYWFRGKYRFAISVPETYPFDPPKVKLLTKIFHPNIDYEGNVSLNILWGDWKPIFELFIVIVGLYSLFITPNPNDCANSYAGSVLRNNEAEFRQLVKGTLEGQCIDGQHFKNY